LGKYIEDRRKSGKIAVAAHPEGEQRRQGLESPRHHIENSALKADFPGRSGVADLLIDLEGGLSIS
jgi:hypothetical protein